MNRKQRRELKKDRNLIIELYSIIKKYLPDLLVRGKKYILLFLIWSHF